MSLLHFPLLYSTTPEAGSSKTTITTRAQGKGNNVEKVPDQEIELQEIRAEKARLAARRRVLDIMIKALETKEKSLTKRAQLT